MKTKKRLTCIGFNERRIFLVACLGLKLLDLRFSQRPTLDGRKAQGAPGGSSDLQRAPDLREERRVRATEVRLGRRVDGVHREQPGEGNQEHEGIKLNT